LGYRRQKLSIALGVWVNINVNVNVTVCGWEVRICCRYIIANLLLQFDNLRPIQRLALGLSVQAAVRAETVLFM